ncbi:MAG: MoaD/ThiS family protein [Hyphomonadaceae bacterium]
MVRVLFFGRLRDLAGGAECAAPLEGPIRLSALRARIGAGDDALSAALEAPSLRVAVNASLLARGDDPEIQHGDEVAFMPPFSGG